MGYDGRAFGDGLPSFFEPRQAVDTQVGIMSRISFQIVGIVAIAVFLIVGWDLVQRVTMTWRSQQIEQELDQAIARAEATHTALAAQKQYAQTDAFVEDRARANNYVRDGETLVHPLITPAAPSSSLTSPTPVPTPSNTGERISNFFQDLIEFLFGP
jgi:cell division protein FtsB